MREKQICLTRIVNKYKQSLEFIFISLNFKTKNSSMNPRWYLFIIQINKQTNKTNRPNGSIRSILENRLDRSHFASVVFCLSLFDLDKIQK